MWWSTTDAEIKGMFAGLQNLFYRLQVGQNIALQASPDTCRPVYPYGFAIIPTDSDLKFRCYAGWVKNDGHRPIFPFPHFKAGIKPHDRNCQRAKTKS